MGGALFSDDFVVGRFGADLLQDFLKFAFGISLGVVGVECVKLGCEELEDDGFSLGEAAVEVDGSDDGFEGIGEVGVAFASSAPVFAVA